MSMHGSENANGYILIQARPGNEVSTLTELVMKIPGVVKVELVRGAYDVIAEVRERREPPRTSTAAQMIRELDGVLRAIPLALDSRVASAADSDHEAA